MTLEQLHYMQLRYVADLHAKDFHRWYTYIKQQTKRLLQSGWILEDIEAPEIPHKLELHLRHHAGRNILFHITERDNRKYYFVWKYTK